MGNRSKKLNVALVTSVYSPLNISGADQLKDLSTEFLKQGLCPTVFVPSSDLGESSLLEYIDGVQVLRLKSMKIRDVGYIHRTISELLLPFFMLYHFRKSQLKNTKFDGVIYYSPTIFLGPFVKYLVNFSSCKSYLIVRDIFPEWAVDLGLMKRGLIYRFFKIIERYQYKQADVIGVQSSANIPYFDNTYILPEQRVEVLHNWLNKPINIGSSISVEKSTLRGRTIFVYAGNMGIAQGMNILVDLADSLKNRDDIGFIFVGRGSFTEQMRLEIKNKKLTNVILYDEIPSSEIAGLYAQCHVGLVALDQRHKTHNIPGKFLSYMQAGLPVLAAVNEGNDLESLIKSENVGRVTCNYSTDILKVLALELVDECTSGKSYLNQCNALSGKLFSPVTAVNQIVSALEI